jgi:GNAT superfamily N-acetyltransferase
MIQAMLDPMFRTLRAFWLANAEASAGGSTLELPGVAVSIVPAMLDRSVVNCVVYDDAAALEDQLETVAAAYDEAGVLAWTVWVHESDERAQAALSAAGSVLDGEPMGQARDLEGVEQPAGGELDLVEHPTPEDFDPVVEAAYGWPGFAKAMPGFPAGFHPYVALSEGRRACCLGTFDCDGDTGIQLVGTVPEARGRGLAGGLLSKALVDARERGCTTTTLQATKMGYPVYSRLGYRDFGRVQMWERRKPVPPD